MARANKIKTIFFVLDVLPHDQFNNYGYKYVS